MRLLAPLLAWTLLTATAVAGEAPSGEPIVAVEVAGKPIDPPAKVAAFLLGAGGERDDQPTRDRLAETVRTLGYLHTEPPRFEAAPGGIRVRFTVEPARVVRHVDVRGNWPVLVDDIRRRLSLRPGSRLPSERETPTVLQEEANRVKDFLRRDGYFDCDADVVVKEDQKPEWVNLVVLVHLGRFYRIGDIVPHYGDEGRAETQARGLQAGELQRVFRPHPLRLGWFGRFRLDQMRDDGRAAEALYRERGYPAARVIPEFDLERDLDRKSGRARVRLRITEKGQVRLRFSGNRALMDRELRGKVTIFNSGSYDDVELRESARELRRLYQSRGYLEAEVDYQRRREGELQEITFVIDEGRELKVRGVELIPEVGAGPLSIPEAVLRDQVQTRVFPRLGDLGLGEGGYATDLQLSQDLQRLTAYYQQAGFPKVKIRAELTRDRGAFGSAGVLGADVAAEWGPSDALYARFYISEGRRELVDGVEVTFRGPHSRSAEEIAGAMRLAADSPFSAAALDGELQRLAALYGQAGRPYATIDPTASTWDPEHRRVRLRLVVDEGPEVRFGPILVRGNFRTLRAIVLADLPFREGDLFDAGLLALGERNLQGHGIYNGVRVQPFGLTSRANPVPILIEVQERYDNWGTPLFTIGYATDIGLSESLGYFWGNVFGLGSALEIRGDVAEDFGFAAELRADKDFFNYRFWRLLSASARYVHPHVGHPSLRLEVSGVVRKESTIRLGTIFSFGTSTSLSWVPSPRIRLFGRFDFTRSTLQNIEFQRLPGRNDGLQMVPDNTDIAKFTLGTQFDDRRSLGGARNPLLPVEGWLVAGTVAFELLHRFFVVAGQVQRYQPLGSGFTLIANLRGDWGIPLEGPALPAIERFYAGGDTTTRGYATDQLKVEVIRGDVSPAHPVPLPSGSPAPVGYRFIPQGGNIRFLGTLELQFPIAELGGFPWVGSLFLDGGTIFNRPDLFVVERDLKASVGISLFRLLTPVGPISLEYAYPLTPSFAEEQWKRETAWYLHWPGRIHFNWGIPILR